MPRTTAGRPRAKAKASATRKNGARASASRKAVSSKAVSSKAVSRKAVSRKVIARKTVTGKTVTPKAPPERRKVPLSAARVGASTSKRVRTYRSALAYLKSLTNFENAPPVDYSSKTFKLRRMQKLLTVLGHPEKKMRAVHIAGTKGKGSTATMLACMLRTSGYKVGLYTSPHVISVRERMKIDGVVPSERAFAKTIAKVADAVPTAFGKDCHPTFFEVLTAAAFDWFCEQGVEVAVVEAGLGGRLDSTNVIKPEVCGITSISYDHTPLLGNSLAEIAEEKAGIFKNGVPVVSAPQRPEVATVLRRVAAEKNAPLSVPGEEIEYSFRFEFSRAAGRHTRLSLTTPTSRFEHLHVPLQGDHQAINCSVALSMMDVLKTRGFEIDDQKAIEGLADVRMSGRMEMVSEEPRILADAAHNAASIEALMRAIGQNVPYDSMIVIFACQKDKDIPGMLRHIQLGADKVIFTNCSAPRSMDPHDLLQIFQEKSGKMVQVADTLEQAIQIASSAITPEDLICITGTFHIVGQAKRLYRKTELV